MISLFSLCLIAFSSSPALADPVGTIVHADGSMTAIYSGNGRIYVATFDKNGNTTGCRRESLAEYQIRKAYTKAKSQWRAGYVPGKLPCF
jgi:hypothetical protein